MFRPNRFVVGPFLMSFETGEQAEMDIYMPAKCKVRKMRTHVVKALANTDEGTITLKNSADAAMANGVCTHALSAALDHKQSASPTTNNTCNADDFVRVVAAKTTAGGKVLVTLECEEVH